MFPGFDLKRFVKEVLGGLGGGFISEVLVTKLPGGIAEALGKWTTPVLGAGIGLLGQYLGETGKINKDIADVMEFSGAVTVGNWIWEMIKGMQAGGGGGGATAHVAPATQQVIYVPPVTEKKKKEFATLI